MEKAQAAMKAFIMHEDRVLILRESLRYISQNIGKWDVPGGRIENNENAIEGLLREIKEETGLLEVKVGNPFAVGDWYPLINNVRTHIVGTFVECFSPFGIVKLGEDHDAYEWIDPESYKNYKMVKALPEAFSRYLNR